MIGRTAQAQPGVSAQRVKRPVLRARRAITCGGAGGIEKTRKASAQSEGGPPSQAEGLGTPFSAREGGTHPSQAEPQPSDNLKRRPSQWTFPTADTQRRPQLQKQGLASSKRLSSTIRGIRGSPCWSILPCSPAPRKICSAWSRLTRERWASSK